MMFNPKNTCPKCCQMEGKIASLEKMLGDQRILVIQTKIQCNEEVGILRARIAELEEQLAASKKNSTNSSKPPSSDIVKPPPVSSRDPNITIKIGGQPGHPRHEREPFGPDQLTGPPAIHYIELCPDCGGGLETSMAPTRVLQQIDLPVIQPSILEHQSVPGWCSHCKKNHYSPFPEEIENGGLVGPRLTALIAFLKGGCHASFSTIRKYLRDVVCVKLSRGLLSKVISKVSEVLDQPYEELLKKLPEEKVVNCDETGHKNNGKRWWTWCFRASLYTLFKIDATRKADVLVEVLGQEFKGVLGCDYFSAYRRYMKEVGIQLQFCLAHLIRELRFLLTLPSEEEQAYGSRLLGVIKKMFEIIHRRETLSEEEFVMQLKNFRAEILHVGTENVPSGKHSQNLAKRFRVHGENYFLFITTPGVEPTNNVAEQAIRFVVIDRLITQGTRSKHGRRWCERIWTVIATCSSQGRSVFEYLVEAVAAHFAGRPVPSLLGK